MQKNDNAVNRIFNIALDIFTAHDIWELMEPVVCNGDISGAERQQLIQYFSRMQSAAAEVTAPTKEEGATAKDIFIRMMLAHPNWFEATFLQKIKKAPIIFM